MSVVTVGKTATGTTIISILMTAGCGCGSEIVQGGLLLMITLLTTGVIIAGIMVLTTAIRRSTRIHRLTTTGAVIITGTVTTILIVPGLSW